MGAETTEQPRRKRGMSYGTRGARRRTSDDDPTIIPSTQPIGFLGKLPWKLGGTLRYRPSAADLQDRPGKHGAAETEPLLEPDDGSDYGAERRAPRQRSGTTGSGDTSDSYRSRGDIFPSDGEGEEDAVPLSARHPPRKHTQIYEANPQILETLVLLQKSYCGHDQLFKRLDEAHLVDAGTRAGVVAVWRGDSGGWCRARAAA
ncbi:hypothetical protein OCS_01915 [Ophiocordyceps sinensis CO18]|uniref:Uncharacterized protein n=1 Tax=Ophiocordyceps sinensis (strain Co18 / CGMCC 3.14243) TaxID=911162 RepID=T5AKT9_OPHSC|nr:hypothetical protein OCS_01915 [Ophiocordyceps sinensis CO18]